MHAYRKLEASVGQADEARYLQAEWDLQPAMKTLYWRAMKKAGLFRVLG